MRPRVRTSRVATNEMHLPPAGGALHESWVVIYAADGADVSRRVAFDPAREAYTIGRSSQCDVVVNSDAASRRHARVERDGAGWRVVDLESLNGTYVNDARIASHRLAHGDRVQVGDTIFKHLAGDDVEAAYLEAIRAAMVTDGLTQAANERAFRHDLANAVARAQAAGTDVGLAIADLDFFKQVNDTYGHPAGDRVLREFVRVVRAALPADVVVGRVGGEEFALLAPGRALEPCVALAEAARAAVAAHEFATPVGVLRLTASFGVAALSPDGDSPTQLFERADQRLYAAKRAGRNRVAG